MAADTSDTINSYSPYFTSEEQVEHGTLKLITKQMIALSEKLEEIWLDGPPVGTFVYRRYYGDYYGHIRIYPGIALPKEYDHTKRNFFIKAAANGNRITITPPYEDAFGAGVVSSFLVPIFVRSPLTTEINDRTMLGVLGIDVMPYYIKYFVESLFEACQDKVNACFLVDNSGYIVYHSKKDYRDYSDITLLFSHIIEEEPTVAKYLINQGHLNQKECLEFGYMKRLVTWQLQLESPIRAFDSYPFFDLLAVSNTNLFLGIKNENKARTEVSTCTCPERNTASYGLAMFQCPADQCTCPCVNTTDYDPCNNDFQVKESSPKPCVPQPLAVSPQSPVADERSLTDALPACYSFECSSGKTEGECFLLSRECKWCPTTKQCTSKGCLSVPIFVVIISSITLVLVVAGCVACFIQRRSVVTCCQRGRMPQPGDFIPNADSKPDDNII